MASTRKCEYCGGVILSSDKTCPSCGAPNLLYVEDAASVVLTPHTIKELAEYCAERNMPLYRMRFFIGENYKEPKAFGIYQNDAGEFVVYKNKADGSRSIRYQGRDEEYAVQELYLKLLDECHKRNIWPDTPDGKPPKITKAAMDNPKTGNFKSRSTYTLLCLGIFVALIVLLFMEDLFINLGILEELRLGFFSFLIFSLYYTYNLIYFRIIQTKKEKEEGIHNPDKNTFFRKEHFIIGALFTSTITALNLLLKHPVFYVDLSLLAILSLLASWVLPIGFLLLTELFSSRRKAPTPKSKQANNIKKLTLSSLKATAILLVVCTLIITTIPIIVGNKKDGYYQTSTGIFYKIDNDVYEYTESGWTHTIHSADYLDASDYVYMYDDSWSSDWGMDNNDRFEDSSHYDKYHSSDSDYDSGSSYDSWDSGGTDWGSDW